MVTILDVQTRNCPDYPPVTTPTAYNKHKSKVDYPKVDVVPWRGEKRLLSTSKVIVNPKYAEFAGGSLLSLGMKNGAATISGHLQLYETAIKSHQ